MKVFRNWKKGYVEHRKKVITFKNVCEIRVPVCVCGGGGMHGKFFAKTTKFKITDEIFVFKL